uniref:LNR domain-containing protein n=1 Tax=Grammatophora oceanica TaxID=210454 RepID=A0A7S1UW17_9STRA|mmetsp:Transcript_23336/g.34587  ORF Transcript_23336/g.34587 Transcript_23336/m.34587 type:complete len:874 (+) Transcript_23336:87-2708(+)|eukprot:CAMPEP_0194048362 /NCGR_PEP_ID=MMETSP0009_2-20130614/27047_1 /TAXON_ID=210454 /ORGANISM="Grammatophora oceanica, Strain CCMP 410" /LENGTH=873 /DNA_ID=CAMNT_0038694207 /DNA_START=67 /DNA_END=2688 /DNA_ORIENTATION=+
MKLVGTAFLPMAAATVADITSFEGAVTRSVLNAQKVTRRLEESHTPTFINQHHRRFSLRDGVADTESSSSHRRQADDEAQLACDSAFLSCLGSSKCVDCFGSLQTEGIDWASVTSSTPCQPDVVDFLLKGGHCKSLEGDNDAKASFCSTFNSCVVWDDDPPDAGRTIDGNSTALDCSTLTECKWDGYHMEFIGDGICHDNVVGCYNTEICGYDGGDCCPDTCEFDGAYVNCGVDGYSCRDPNSKDCDAKLTSKCPAVDPANDPDAKPVPECNSDETLYRLLQYDSFGDGWDDTKLLLTPKDDASTILFNDGLKDGAQGTEYVCLSSSPKCYRVQLGGGTWGNEISWEIKPMGEGTKSVADGASPMDCTFSVAGDTCERTCVGKANVKPEDDPDYRSYKELYQCIEKQCLIQVGACQQDTSCLPCFTQDAPEFCFANENFNAVIDCGLCQCDKEDDLSDFCSQKATPGAVIPPNPGAPDEPSAPRQCSPTETLQGANAVMTFGGCTKFDQVGVMVTDFDENNFGALDQFEACAHGYKNEDNHGGRTAQSCMGILHDAINQDDPGDPSIPTDAIRALADLVYNNAEQFCECASEANKEAPLCPSFTRFKTLLYESIDACHALDEIDCDAWNEFYGGPEGCKASIEAKFGSVNFSDKPQCEFVKNSCGGSGPFPAFRKLDCGSEIPKNAWDFYNIYARDCLQGDDGKAPISTPTEPTPQTPAPVPSPTLSPTTPVTPGTPTKAPVPGTPQPVPASPSLTYHPSDDDSISQPPVPYTPPDSGGGKKKKRHTMRNFFLLALLGGAAYFYWKKRREGFSFVRYRRQPRNFGAESEMMGGSGLYSGLSMDTSVGASSFEPPTLPPPPSAVDNGAGGQQYI